MVQVDGEEELQSVLNSSFLLFLLPCAVPLLLLRSLAQSVVLQEQAGPPWAVVPARKPAPEWDPVRKL